MILFKCICTENDEPMSHVVKSIVNYVYRYFNKMGAYLTAPSVEKSSHDEVHDHIEFGLSGMQGWRMSMEVRHIVLLSRIM